MTAEMRRIRTNDGETISIEADTDERTIAILKSAPVVRFSEFVYTGSHPRGENNGNYADMESFLLGSGLTLMDDDLTFLLYDIERVSGITALVHRGKTMRYHVQARRGERHGDFGYTWRADYRLIGVV